MKVALRFAAVLLALAIPLFTMTVVQAAPAAPHSSSQRVAAAKAPVTRTFVPHARYHTGRPGGPASFSGPDYTWSGIEFKFSRTETYYIGSGAGMCALIVGKLPGIFAKVASLGCGVLAWKAAQLLYQGKCMKLTFGYNPITPSMGIEGWNC